jgi:hypothetical protein
MGGDESSLTFDFIQVAAQEFRYVLDRDADRTELAQINKVPFRPRLTGDYHKTSVVHTRVSAEIPILSGYYDGDLSHLQCRITLLPFNWSCRAIRGTRRLPTPRAPRHRSTPRCVPSSLAASQAAFRTARAPRGSATPKAGRRRRAFLDGTAGPNQYLK